MYVSIPQKVRIQGISGLWFDAETPRFNSSKGSIQGEVRGDRQHSDPLVSIPQKVRFKAVHKSIIVRRSYVSIPQKVRFKDIVAGYGDFPGCKFQFLKRFDSRVVLVGVLAVITYVSIPQKVRFKVEDDEQLLEDVRCVSIPQKVRFKDERSKRFLPKKISFNSSKGSIQGLDDYPGVPALV